jgi:hypothetical protein
MGALVTAEEFVSFERAQELGSGWSAVGFWSRSGRHIRVRLQGPATRIIDAELDVVNAVFLDAVPCASSGRKVEQLVLGISCELSSSSLALVE